MVSQGIWIGIAVGVFFAGLGVGIAAIQSTAPTPSFMMTNQQMQQMMDDPQLMNQWQQRMMQDPQLMNEWMNTMMNDPQLMNQMHSMMMNDPQHMNQMMQHQGMMNTMMDNQQMMNMMSQGMMDGQMMHSGMMGHMTGSTITEKDDVLTIINKIESMLDQISINYKNGNQDTAFSLATKAYLDNYEYIEGPIAQKDKGLMEKIELMMRIDLRSMIKNGESSESVDSKIDSIKTELKKVKPLFQ